MRPSYAGRSSASPLSCGSSICTRGSGTGPSLRSRSTSQRRSMGRGLGPGPGHGAERRQQREQEYDQRPGAGTWTRSKGRRASQDREQPYRSSCSMTRHDHRQRDLQGHGRRHPPQRNLAGVRVPCHRHEHRPPRPWQRRERGTLRCWAQGEDYLAEIKEAPAEAKASCFGRRSSAWALMTMC